MYIGDADIEVFQRRLSSEGEAELKLLVEEVNRAATLHEFVPGNEPIGRAVYRTDATSADAAGAKDEAAGAADGEEERRPVPPLELEETLGTGFEQFFVSLPLCSVHV